MKLFIYKNDQQLGPFDETQIKNGLWKGEFEIDDFAWKEGLTEWVKLGDLLKDEEKTPKIQKNAVENRNIIHREDESNQASGFSAYVFPVIACTCLLLTLTLTYWIASKSPASPAFNTESNVNKDTKYTELVVKIIFSADNCQQRIDSILYLWSSSIKDRLSFEEVYISWNKNTEDSVKKINEEKQEIESLLMGLSESSGKQDNIHRDIVDLFNSYKELYKSATEPSGNYISYNSNCSEIVKNFSDSLSRIKYSSNLTPDLRKVIDGADLINKSF